MMQDLQVEGFFAATLDFAEIASRLPATLTALAMSCFPDINQQYASDGNLSHLAHLSRLQRLRLSMVLADEQAIPPALSGLTSLVLLESHGLCFSSGLQGLPCLRRLDLCENCTVGVDGLLGEPCGFDPPPDLSPLQQLEELSFGTCRPDWFGDWLDHPHDIYIFSWPLPALSTLRTLRSLRCLGCDLAPLAEAAPFLSALTHLTLERCDVAGLDLSRFSALREVQLAGVRGEPLGVEELRAAGAVVAVA